MPVGEGWRGCPVHGQRMDAPNRDTHSEDEVLDAGAVVGRFIPRGRRGPGDPVR
ncbi:MAG: hypothetical protein RLZ45_1568 [Verrucomicrobiota bacterium]|jgi:hypothetical protein